MSTETAESIEDENEKQNRIARDIADYIHRKLYDEYDGKGGHEGVDILGMVCATYIFRTVVQHEPVLIFKAMSILQEQIGIRTRELLEQTPRADGTGNGLADFSNGS